MENTGEFLLYYSIEVAPIKHPSIVYMTETKLEEMIKNDNDKTTDMSTKKDKLRIDK